MSPLVEKVSGGGTCSSVPHQIAAMDMIHVHDLYIYDNLCTLQKGRPNIGHIRFIENKVQACKVNLFQT